MLSQMPCIPCLSKVDMLLSICSEPSGFLICVDYILICKSSTRIRLASLMWWRRLLPYTVDMRFVASEQSKQNVNVNNASIFTVSNHHRKQANFLLKFPLKNCHSMLPPPLNSCCVTTSTNKISRVTYGYIYIDLPHGLLSGYRQLILHARYRSWRQCDWCQQEGR